MQERYSLFSELKKMVKKPLRKTRTGASWILDKSCRLVDKRTTLGRKHTENQ